MSKEALKRKLVPLIRAGFRDDVRCQLLIHLKEHPQDEEVWHWYLAASDDQEARLRVAEQWLRFNPGSRKALEIIARLSRDMPGLPHEPQPAFTPPSSGMPKVPFSAWEYFKTIFVGQREVVETLAMLVEQIKDGAQHHILLRAPRGWGKTLLASLALDYIDPQGADSVVHDGAGMQLPGDLGPQTVHLIDDIESLAEAERLTPFLEQGQHVFIMTRAGLAPIPAGVASRVRELVFTEYSLLDLGLIVFERLHQQGLNISTEFMLQIARYCNGSPKQAVSYAERLGTIWAHQEMPDSLGELIFMLDDTLSERPPDPDHNFLAVWEQRVFRGIGPGTVQAALGEYVFPFGLNLRIARSQIEFVPEDRRKAQVAGALLELPPFIFQRKINTAGPLAPTIGGVESKGIILGAYSRPELEGLVSCCGFTLEGGRDTGSLEPGFEPIPEEIQQKVWERDGGACTRCGSSQELGFDHIIPLKRGGSSSARNVQLLCQSCYQARNTPE